MNRSIQSSAVCSPRIEIASLCLAAVTLSATLLLHLLPALLSGLVTFVLIHALSRAMAGRLSSVRGKLLAVALIAMVVIGGLTALVFGVISLLKADAGLSALFQKMATILDDASRSLPASMIDSPGSRSLKCARPVRMHVVGTRLRRFPVPSVFWRVTM